MKKQLLFLFLLVFCFTLANGQHSFHCGTDSYMEMLKQQDPELSARMAVDETRLQQLMSSSRISSQPVNIRVVVHVVWNTPVQNISDAQVLSQIDVLNE